MARLRPLQPIAKHKSSCPDASSLRNISINDKPLHRDYPSTTTSPSYRHPLRTPFRARLSNHAAMHVLASLPLFIAASAACKSFCICQKHNSDPYCIAEIGPTTKQHDCAGYCHDRACAGTTPTPEYFEPYPCRVWNGFCDFYAQDTHPKLDPCDKKDKDGKHIYNDCPKKNSDCP